MEDDDWKNKKNSIEMLFILIRKKMEMGKNKNF